MNRLAKSLLISSAIHLLIVCLVLTIGSSFAHLNKTVVIDFTLLDSSGSGPAGKTKNTGQLLRESIKHGNSESTPSPAVNSRPRITNSLPTPSKQAPAPATEPTRTAPAAAPAPASPPMQAGASHGSISGRSGRDAGAAAPFQARW